MNKTIYFVANWKMNGNQNSIREIEKVFNFLKKNVTYKFLSHHHYMKRRSPL